MDLSQFSLEGRVALVTSADLALFLASDASKYITGQTIRIDRGIAIGAR